MGLRNECKKMAEVAKLGGDLRVKAREGGQGGGGIGFFGEKRTHRKGEA